MNLFAELWTSGTVSDIWVKRMGTGVDRYVRSDQCPSANGHQTCVKYRTVEVDEDIAGDLEIGAVIYMYWWLDPRLVVEKRLVFLLGGCWGRQWVCLSSNTDGTQSP